MLEPEPLKRLGAVVHNRRVELGLSQEELGKRAGLHRNYVGGIERGERNIGFINLLHVARALEWTLVQLAAAVEASGE